MKKILLSVSVVGVMSLGSLSMAQTTYQCLTCPEGTFTYNSNQPCKSINQFTKKTLIINLNEGETQSGTLAPGVYIVALGGGKRQDNSAFHPQFRVYRFIVHQNTNFTMRAGHEYGGRNYSPSSAYFDFNGQRYTANAGGYGGYDGDVSYDGPGESLEGINMVQAIPEVIGIPRCTDCARIYKAE